MIQCQHLSELRLLEISCGQMPNISAFDVANNIIGNTSRRIERFYSERFNAYVSALKNSSVFLLQCDLFFQAAECEPCAEKCSRCCYQAPR